MDCSGDGSRHFELFAPEKRDSEKLGSSGKLGPVDEIEEDAKVAKKGHSEEQILQVMRQAGNGTRVADICREHGISEATFYTWKKKYSGTRPSELLELTLLGEENSKLKNLVADLSLDRHILQEIVQKKQ